MNNHLKINSMLRLALASLFSMSLLLLPVDGTAQRLSEDGYYQIMAKHSNKVLDVKGGTSKTCNGISIHQWEANGGDNQLFRFQEVDNGFYRIIVKSSGKALDVEGGEGKTCNGVDIQQWETNGQDNQLFRLVDQGDGYFLIVAKHSQKALDVYGAGDQNGANLVQYEVNGSDNQLFRLIPEGRRETLANAGQEY